jgi:hypothetical protein
MEEMSNCFTRARETNEFRATMIVAGRCSRKIFSDVSMLDFHTTNSSFVASIFRKNFSGERVGDEFLK